MLVFVVLLGLVASAAYGGYQEIVPWSTFSDAVSTYTGGQVTPASYTKAVADGSTVYAEIRSSDPTTAWYVKVENAGTESESASVIYHFSGLVNSGSSMTVVGDDLFLANPTLDEIWKINKNGADLGGTHDVILDKAQLLAQTGGDAILSSTCGVDNTGQMVFFEMDIDQIWRTTGVGTAEIVLTNAEIVAGTGRGSPSGQLAFDVSGNMYFGESVTDGVYKYDGTNITQLFSVSDITSLTGETSFTPGGNIYNPADGLIYFRDAKSHDILSYDPADPANTLEVMITKEALAAGPLGTSFVIYFSLFDGQLAASALNSGNLGFCTIPEPITMVLMGLGGLVVARRRR